MLEQVLLPLSLGANASGGGECGSDDYKRPLFVGVYSVVLLVGVPCNLTALVVFACLTPRKTSSTVFMMNLAASDLFFCLTLPNRIAYYSPGQWSIRGFLCSVSVYLFYVNLYTSIYFLTALSVFRYVAIVHPVRAKALLTFRRSVWISLGIWLLVGSATGPFLRPPLPGVNGTVRCFDLAPLSVPRVRKQDLVALVVGFLLPFLTIIHCYARILWTLRHPVLGLPRQNAHNRRKSIYMVVIVLASFLFCFLPYHLSRTVYLNLRIGRCGPSMLAVQKAIVATMCLAVANSCLNPLLYYFVGSSFRTALTSSFQQTGRRSRSEFAPSRLTWPNPSPFVMRPRQRAPAPARTPGVDQTNRGFTSSSSSSS